MPLSFDNTKIAFAHKSDRELKKAYRLFQTFGIPALVKYGPKLSNAALAIGLPIKGIIKKTIFAQFCGGETIDESHPSALELYENGIGAILDYSVEGEGSEDDFVATYEELVNVIQESANRTEYPFAVFKCTGIGSFSMLQERSEAFKTNTPLDNTHPEYLAFKERMESLCSLAYNAKTKLLIDAEETWIQDTIDDITYRMMVETNKEEAIVYNTIQLYRTGRLPEMEKRIQDARDGGYKIGFKLVRGAYMEKEANRAEELDYENPMQPSKQACDNDYNAALKLCFEHKDIVSICAGTHNEESSALLAELITTANIDKSDDRFWFAQLYGMSDHISYNLAKEGFNVAKYLPYGPIKEVLPYLSRRAQENSSVKGQAGRELSLINKEIKRRKMSLKLK